MGRPRKEDSLGLEIKNVIIDAALAMIIEDGVAGATSRRIAARARVSPGTVTYHFSGMNEIVAAAFVRMSEGIAAIYFSKLREARDKAQAREVVADLICGDLWKVSGQMLLVFELYSFVSRFPEYMHIMDDWMALSRQALQIHFDERAARAIDALIEGFTIHNTLGRAPVERGEILRLIEAVS